jgi:hypothetical protein
VIALGCDRVLGNRVGRHGADGIRRRFTPARDVVGSPNVSAVAPGPCLVVHGSEDGDGGGGGGLSEADDGDLLGSEEHKHQQLGAQCSHRQAARR